MMMKMTTTMMTRAVAPQSVRKTQKKKSIVVIAKAREEPDEEASSSSRSSSRDDEKIGLFSSPATVKRRQAFALAAAAGTTLLFNEQTIPAAFAAYGTASGGGDEASQPVTYSTFYGAAEPPATYGKVGGTTPNRAKYSYEVPSTWKEEPTSKVEKGSGGQDSRWVPRGVKGVKAVLVTLNRAGEDGQEFSLQDTTINALAGSDPNLQDALLNGLVKTNRSNVEGQEYIQYDIEAAIYYGVKATVDSTGRLFALIISAPDNVYKKERNTYERMLDSFRTYILDTTK
ncbi:unnamed protein product [Bathycoccus prasinos]|mmetsp:Transcript_5646/g.17892  ORF Transcript_5646/g.17892 Transcript_5646/m.17892 type:complete len:286 (+) Transcript_5646:179-1036(+)